METCTCPKTKLFNKLSEKFKKGMENHVEQQCSHVKDHLKNKGDHSHKKCSMDHFAGKIDNTIYSRLEEDVRTREELARGITRELSIQFTDIRGFTARTAEMAPENILTILDLFIPEMLHIIIDRHRGMVDKLLGDGIMALYGHPYSTGSETLQALYAAIDMQQAASAMGAVLELMDIKPIEIGIGINTGSVLICEVGDERYRESTVIGSPVNLAAKMEEVAKANEIVMPQSVLPSLERQKPDITRYFHKNNNTNQNIETLNFDWTAFLSDNQRERKDWEIKSA